MRSQIPHDVGVGLKETEIDAHRIEVKNITELTRRHQLADLSHRGRIHECVIDEEPAALAAAWSSLIADPDRRRAMGAAARRDAQLRFTPARMAEFGEAFYAAVLRSAPISSR